MEGRKEIFAGGDFEDRFLNKYSKRLELPSFSYLGTCFHPTLQDHVFVLSKNSFPKAKYERMVPQDISDGIKYDGWMEKFQIKAKENLYKEERIKADKVLFDLKNFKGDQTLSNDFVSEEDVLLGATNVARNVFKGNSLV